jgi:non-ribosomal peptide synthetase component F
MVPHPPHPLRPWGGTLLFLDRPFSSEAIVSLTPKPGQASFFTLDGSHNSNTPAHSSAEYVPNHPATGTSRCYIIYTSGSTGKPKGVAIEHRAACALVAAERALFNVQPTDVIYHGFSVSFDASVEEVC